LGLPSSSTPPGSAFMGDPPFAIQPLSGTQVVSLQASSAQTATLQALASQFLHITLPQGPRCAQAPELTCLGVGPRRWLLIRRAADNAWPSAVEQMLGGVAAVCDQSDGYVIFEAWGTQVRSVLARGVSVDLHPRSLQADAVAVTQVGHINVVLWHGPQDGSHRFCLAVGRSYAESFMRFWQPQVGSGNGT